MQLKYPENPIPYRVVGIDPGSVTLGVAVLDLNIDTHAIELIDARTFDASKSLQPYWLVAKTHGDRVARLMAHEDGLYGYFCCMQPQAIASESPYMGRFPQAYAALTECMTSIRRAVWRYDNRMPLHLSDPMTVKAAVGVVSKGRKNREALSKDHVQEGVLNLDLINHSGIDISKLDEHSIDAIAVAKSRIDQMLQP